jgi:hypothetical protein
MASSLPMVVGEAVWPCVRDSIGTSAYSSASLQQGRQGARMAGWSVETLVIGNTRRIDAETTANNRRELHSAGWQAGLVQHDAALQGASVLARGAQRESLTSGGRLA